MFWPQFWWSGFSNADFERDPCRTSDHSSAVSPLGSTVQRVCWIHCRIFFPAMKKEPGREKAVIRCLCWSFLKFLIEDVHYLHMTVTRRYISTLRCLGIVSLPHHQKPWQCFSGGSDERRTASSSDRRWAVTRKWKSIAFWKRWTIDEKVIFTQ